MADADSRRNMACLQSAFAPISVQIYHDRGEIVAIFCDICGGPISMKADGNFYCETCGVRYEKDALIAKLAPAYPQVWEWAASEDGVEISRYLDEEASEIEVPESIDGKPVISLGKGVFYAKKKLQKIQLPDNIRQLGRMCFCKCQRLERIRLPQNLIKVGSDAFTNCARLQTVVFPSGLLEIESAAFSGCVSLEEALIPDWVQIIPMLAFCGCTGLKRVTLPPTLKEIQDSAFCSCSSLSEITLPDNLQRIGTMAFWGCRQLKQLRIPAAVSSFGKMIFDADSAKCPTLLVVPGSAAERWAADHKYPYELYSGS